MDAEWPFLEQTVDLCELRDEIRSSLRQWRTFVVAIDGYDGTGKSTLGRYLSWQLGMPSIETDLFFDERPGLSYRLDDLKTVLEARFALDRPVIIEGLRILQLLNDLSLASDYLIWVERPGNEASLRFQEHFASYETNFQPRRRADKIFIVPPLN